MYNELRKSIYILLSSLLGIFLFVALHRIFVFILLVLANASYSSSLLGLSYVEFTAADYFTLMLAIIFGAWYGIWLGMYWYKKVYEERSHGGWVSHVVDYCWPAKTGNDFSSKIAAAKQHLESNLWELEDIAKAMPAPQSKPKAIKRRVVRKKAPKSLT